MDTNSIALIGNKASELFEVKIKIADKVNADGHVLVDLYLMNGDKEVRWDECYFIKGHKKEFMMEMKEIIDAFKQRIIADYNCESVDFATKVAMVLDNIAADAKLMIENYEVDDEKTMERCRD
jgi:hypothetical protein